MEVQTKLRWNGDKIKIKGRKVVNKSAFETGLIVEGQAKLLTPVDTGRLAASISTQSINNGSSGGVDTIAKPTQLGVVLVGTPVNYGPYIEFGTIKSNAQAFLRPALALAQGKVLSIIKKNGKYIFAGYLK